MNWALLLRYDLGEMLRALGMVNGRGVLVGPNGHQMGISGGVR